MSFWQDVKYGVRMLRREPGFTAVMVSALALGIGVNTTVFTLVNAVLFRGLPFDEPDRVMYLSTNHHARNRTDQWLSYPDLRDWRAARSFSGIAAFTPRDTVFADDVGAPERYNGPEVTANFFSLIGQKPLLGRDFLPEEEKPGAPAVCIIGYSIWENRYGLRPDILGKAIRVNEKPATIIGVMPKGMRFPVRADLWIPLTPQGEWEKRDFRNLQAFGRLAPDASMRQARAETDGIARRLAKEYPATNDGITAMVIPYNDEFNGGKIRTIFFVLLGAVGFVLLIACANVANLLLSRALARAREMSIRAALGASRWRVVRQLLIESVMVGLLGGVLGLAIAYWGVGLFDKAVADVGKPYWITFKIDLTVFAYLVAICVGSGLIFGLAPALQLARVDLNATLKEGGRGSSGGLRTRWLSGFLVVSEVALSIVLLAGAGLMVRSFLNMYGVTKALHGERMLSLHLNLTDSRYKTPESRLAFYDHLYPLHSATPGVESASIVTHPPFSGAFRWQFQIEGSAPVGEEKRPSSDAVVADAAYFRTAGIAVVRGRGFTEFEKDGVIVSRSFAARYFPAADPIGKRLRVFWDGDRPWMTIVGVSQDVQQRTGPSSSAESDPVFFVPYRGKPMDGFGVLVRANAPAFLTSVIRKRIQAVDPDLPVSAMMTLDAAFAQERWPFRVFGTLFAVFAAIALLLSSVGLYATMAYSVTRRTQEIGVRVAMGASAGNILRLVLSQGVRQLTIGLGIGLAGAFGIARVLQGILFQVSPTDPTVFAAVAIVLGAVGLLACLLPARSAMKVDPTVALRYE
jgi:putative ABC transport system permease protein